MQPRDATPLGDADTVVGEVASPPAASTLRRGDAVGRYLVIEPLGSGGMGVVHAAYDPELDRKVAVKLLHAAAGASQGPSPLLGEAQALARLAHPNVVAVHDAGTLGDRVWLAMELVHGCTLTAWAAQRERHWREVVEVAIAVGRGLAAAHAVGLVHRDVKPDNIMIDEDPRAPFGIGRVRVMDFGLARGGGAPAASTRATPAGAPVPEVSLEGALAGTPAYMAPEQFAGLRADARCDQFSLCAVIWECLWRKRPFAGDTLAALAANVLEGRIDVPSHKRGVPAWLRAAVRRGLERDPQRRFPDMNALVTALQRGQARRRQRQIAVVAASVVLLGAGGFAAQAVVQARRTVACEREGAAIAELWSESRRDATDQALRALPVRYAAVTAERVRPWLDDYAAAWGRARTEACLDARTRDRWTEAQLERASWCLDERRMEFAALVEQLSHADVLVAQNAVRAAASLASVEPCRDVHALERLPPPPTEQRDQVVAIKAELAHAGTFALASRPAEGLAIVAEARAQADALGWPPLRAAALLVESKLRDDAADYEGAARVGAEAYFEAARIDAWDLAAWVATQLIYTVGEHSRRREPGLEWARHAEMALAHAGASGGVGEARRLRAIGGVEFAAGHFQQAREAGESSVTLYEHAVGPEHPEVAYALIGVGNALHGAGDYAGALATQQRALAVLEAALGPEHPEVGGACENIAGALYDMGEYEQARAVQLRALAIWEATLEPDHPKLAFSLSNLGTIYDAAGEYDESLPLYQRAAASLERTLGPEHPDLALVLNNLAAAHRATGDATRAAALYRRALAIAEKANGPDHPDVAMALANLGDVLLEAGDAAAARAMQERALDIRERMLGADHHAVASTLGSLAKVVLAQGDVDGAIVRLERAVQIYERIDGVQEREAEFHFALARALDRRGRDRARALRLAQQARDAWRDAGSRVVELAEVEAWLRERGG